MEFAKFGKLPPEKQENILRAGISAFSRFAYSEAGTESIAAACGISKGLLFHYFGSKRDYYLYCLGQALERLASEETGEQAADFYGTLFGLMDTRLRLCRRWPEEARFLTMASRETAGEGAEERALLLRSYRERTGVQSTRALSRALAALPLRNPEDPRVQEGLILYIGAILEKFLRRYQDTPDAFFADAETVEKEMREYIGLMLRGVCRGGQILQ